MQSKMGFGKPGKPDIGGVRAPMPSKLCTSITDGLKTIYFQKVLGRDAVERSEGSLVCAAVGARCAEEQWEGAVTVFSGCGSEF
eukprot:146423-Chlamydomonas_euryale.AAC.2